MKVNDPVNYFVILRSVGTKAPVNYSVILRNVGTKDPVKFMIRKKPC